MRQSFTHTHTFPPFHSHIHPPRASTRPPRASNPLKTSRLASPHRPILSSSRLPPHLSRRVASRRVASRRVAHRSFDGILRTRKVPSTVSRHQPRPSERRRSLVVVVARARQRRRRGRPRGASRRRTGAFAGRGRVSFIRFDRRSVRVPSPSRPVFVFWEGTIGSVSDAWVVLVRVYAGCECVCEREDGIDRRSRPSSSRRLATRADARVSAEDVVASRWHGGRREGG